MMKVKPKVVYKRYLVLFMLLLIFGLLPGHTYAQGNHCRTVNFQEALNHPEQNGFFRITQKFIPPHTNGDADFVGHGPKYIADVKVWYTPKGIYENVYMHAWEVDKAGEEQNDYTSAEGSDSFWFYKPPAGWELRQIRLFYNYPGEPPNISNTLNIGGEWKDLVAPWHVESRDENGPAPEPWINPSRWFWNVNQYGGISHIDIVGDAKGDDAGVQTAISVSIPADSHKTWVMICR